MNRIFFSLAALLGALMPLFFDSALKGAALLAIAMLTTLALRRASAATRHLVWVVAVVALLVVPVLSVALPQWRVLPKWAASPLADTALPAPSAAVAQGMERIPPPAEASAPLSPPTASVVPPPPASTSHTLRLTTHGKPRTWRDWLPLAWCAGFALLALRLLAAHLLLRRASRHCPALTAPPDEKIAAAFSEACTQLGITQRVTLLLDQRRTIPVVWGVFRPRLLLPIEARAWTDDQLRSVLLHELAHIKRRDTLVQWLTQIACALHWWNPLVWLAAWRLHAERERACDDLVLASGVRPSAYAEHLLDIATKLSPARWTAACGLAMARKSSLEGRLLAVLSEKLNRRGVTSALAAIALILGAGIAIPVAMLRAADEKKAETKEAPARNLTGQLQPETVAKLKWGEPVDGLRMALAWPPMFDDSVLGKEPYFQIVVQNVAEKEVRFIAGDDAPNPRQMRWREGERIVFSLSDNDAQKADWQLKPGECGVLRMFSKEERDKDGKTVSAGLENDLTGGTRYHAIAVMEVAKAPAGAWTGKLTSGQTRGSADAAAAPAPKLKDARALYEIWERHARANGDIPGALVGELAAAVKTFIGYNPTWDTVPKLNALLPRLDATRDWKSADAIALLDELAAVQDSPLDVATEKVARRTIRKGEALPKKYADVAWGDAPPGGLRAAWVLEPGAAEHRMGDALKARLLVQNTGQVPVMLQVPTWHQSEVKARNAKGAEVEVSGIEWTTLAQLFPCRLGPGEIIEINTPGVGLGPRAGMGPWAGPRVGSNVLTKPGDELTLTHGLVPLDGSGVGVREDDPHVAGPLWWDAHIKARLAHELPLPADAAERTRLLDRAVRELFATAPTAEETAAFIADQTPGAFDALVKRLGVRVDVVPFSGTLQTAPAKFRVLADDANADKQPRVVLGPGEYPLNDGGGAVTLKIVGRPVGDRRTNDAQLLFEAREATGKLPPSPHKLEVPDGWGTWAIVCRPGEGFFYVLHKGGVRKIDYSNPLKVTDTPANDLPAEFRDEVKRQLDIHEISDAQQAELFEKPAAPATTPEPKTGANVPASDDAPLKPKHEYAQSLFRKWQASARTDGKIPGALIGHVAREVDGFLKQYPADEKTPLLAALRPRLDASRDWTQAEVVALLDDITAISTAPVSWADIPMEFSTMRAVQGGKPLPAELNGAAWGAPAANGLRAAWLLEPRAEQYALGSVLKARVLFHNAGKATVVFKTETWHQADGHTARDAKGAEIKVGGSWFTGITPLATFRLAPGEYCEVIGHGIAIGAGKYEEETSTGSVGAVIEAKVGDEVNFSSSVDASTGGWTRPTDPKDPAKLWKTTIAERIANEAPMPASAADREQLIRRVTPDIFGEPPSAEDSPRSPPTTRPTRWRSSPRAYKRSRASSRSAASCRRVRRSSASSPPTRTPRARRAPRTANAPGRYVLGDGVHLLVSQISTSERRENKATIAFLSPNPKVESPHKPHEIALPDGLASYGIVWERGACVLWTLEHKGLVRKFDFTNPGAVKETRFESGGIVNIPEHLREAMKKAFDAPGAPVQKQMPVKPADGANIVKVPDAQYVKSGFPVDELAGEGVMWNDVQNSLTLGYRITGDEWRILGKEVKVELWVRNPGDKDVKFQSNMRPDIGLRMKLKDETGVKGAKELEHESSIVPNDTPPFGEHRALPPGHAFKVKEFTVSLLWPENDVSGSKGHFFAIAPGAYKFHCEMELPGMSATGEGGKQFTPAADEWTGKLTTRGLNVTVVAPGAPAPKPRIEHVDVDLEKDGTLFLDGKKVTLDELKALAAKDAKKWFTIRADEDVPYAKVIEVVEALKAAGVTEFSFSEAQVGDGKYRVANRQANYEFDGKHHFSICRPGDYPQCFTVTWPAEGERPACWLRTYPNVGGPTQGKWAVVWEPGTNVLWWVDDSDVGKMTLTDPARVIVDREGRTNNFSRDFGLPEEVKVEFRRLGFVIGRDKTPGLEIAIGGNTGGQSIVSAEFGAWSVTGTVTDAEGKSLANVPVRVSTNQDIKTEKTDAKGEYHALFNMPLQLLANWRGVTVEPVLEGFTEREMAKAGEFNVLLRAGEEPQRVRIAGDKDFQPGPIPRFAERDLVPSQPGVSPGTPGRADFVMLKAGEVTGEIVTADGKPAPPHWVAAATPEQRPGHNAAIELSDAQGRFRLKGIPTNKPVIFIVNRGGKPGETSKSSEQKFEQTGTHKIRIFLPAEGSGKGPVKTERLTDGASAPAGGAIRGKVLEPDGSPAAGVQVRVDDGIERWKFRGEGIPELPKTVTTAADGTFSIEVPKGSVATNYEAFASSDEFAPLNARVPTGGDVDVMQFTKGSSVTGRVIGLDGAGLAKVGSWCKRLDWKGSGPAPAKLTSTDADGTFSIPSIAAGKYLLVILTRDLGANELAVAFANSVIETKDDAPVAVDIRPLPTVDLTLDARVLRGNVEFPDFELRVSGTLPGHQAGEPGAFWTRHETTKLTEGKHTIAVPAGLQNATVRADRIYMRKGDEPVFIWRREGVEKREVGNTFELGVADKPQAIGLTVQDAAMLDIHITSPDGKKLTNVKLTGSAECEAWGKLALDEWSQLNFPDHSKGEARFPACERVTFTITADGCEPFTQELGMIKPGEKKEVRVVMKTAAKSGPAK